MPPPFGSGEWELYNLKDDPAEMNDLGGEQPERLEQMVAMWEQYKTDNKVIDLSLDLAEMID
jgi:arylsulfatase